jgi:hypothetical protein
MRRALDAKASDPIVRYIAELLGKRGVFAEEFRMLIGKAGEAPADWVE